MRIIRELWSSGLLLGLACGTVLVFFAPGDFYFKLVAVLVTGALVVVAAVIRSVKRERQSVPADGQLFSSFAAVSALPCVGVLREGPYAGRRFVAGVVAREAECLVIGDEDDRITGTSEKVESQLVEWQAWVFLGRRRRRLLEEIGFEY